MHKRHYGVLIDTGSRYYAYGLFKYTLWLDNSSGENVPYLFKPHLEDCDYIPSEVNREGGSSKASVSLSVYDGNRDLDTLSKNTIIESLKVRLITLDQDLNSLSEIDGYITDYSWADGKASLTLRLGEDVYYRPFMEQFTSKSFQKFEAHFPMDIGISSIIRLKSDTPWTIYRTEYQRTYLGGQSDYYTATNVYYKATNPRNGVAGDNDSIAIRTVMEGSNGNKYVRYIETEAFFLKYSVVDTSSAGDVTIRIGVTNYSSSLGAGFTGDEYMESLASALNSGGITAVYNLDSQRLYVEADPADVNEGYVSGNYDLADGGLVFARSPDSVGVDKILKPVETELFDDPNGAYYAIALVGGSQYQGKTELFLYSYCKRGQYYDPVLGSVRSSGDDRWYLSGIPSNAFPNPAAISFPSTYNGITVNNTTELVEAFGISQSHGPGEIVAPYDSVDKLYVKAGDLLPFNVEDSHLTTGFIYVDGNDIQNNQSSKVLRYFNRYKMSAVHYGVYDEDLGTGVLNDIVELEIHSRPTAIDPTHTEFADLKQSRWELRKGIERDDQVLLAEYELLVSYIDLYMDNIKNDPYQSLLSSIDSSGREELSDRYRGDRFDVYKDYSDTRVALAKLSAGEDSQDQSAVNSRLVNNAEDKFAICTKSEVLKNEAGDKFFERCYFYDELDGASIDNIWSQINEDEAGDSGVEAIVDKATGKTTSGRRNSYLNYMTIRVDDLPSVQSGNFETILDRAKEYFMGRIYRVIKNPVPENNQDLGKFFPIAYGYLDRVPVLQCISKKTFSSDTSTAGDDLYVYASHPCDIKTPADVKLWIFDTQLNPDGEPVDLEEFSNNRKFDLPIVPFPSVVDGHYIYQKMTYDDGSDSFADAPRLVYQGKLLNPYHDMEEEETIDGDKVYGVRLQGDKWNAIVGKLDKRYPVRNGLGSSTLYMSFGGWVDRTGEFTSRAGYLIEHPLDIIHHYIQYYGTSGAENIIDLESKADVVSMTRRYSASVYLTEDKSFTDMLETMCAQFGIGYYYADGKIRFCLMDDEVLDRSKPISEHYNLIGLPEKSSEGYKDVYSRVVVNFDYNYVTQSYRDSIIMDRSNNSLCARAYKASSDYQEYILDAQWLRDRQVAQQVAQRYTRLLCRRVESLKFSVRDTGVVYRPGDTCPLTCAALGYDSVPVVIRSSVLNKHFWEIEAYNFLE